MRNARDLMRIHDALAWRPGEHEPERLDVQVAYSGNYTAMIQAGERRAVVGGESSRDIEGLADTIRTMLRAYPAPATVNRVNVTKCALPGQPDIHQGHEFADPAAAGRPQLERRERGNVYPHIISDGMTYGINPVTHRIGLVISLPDPTDPHPHYRHAIQYIIVSSPQVSIGREDDASIESCEWSRQDGIRITADRNLASEIDRAIRAQWQEALNTIGFDGTIEDALAIPTHHLWQGFREVLPREGATPMVVRAPVSGGPDNETMAETLRMHLEEHPELGILPVRPRLHQRPDATADPHDRQQAETATMTLKWVCYIDETPRPDGRAESISADVTVTEPDGAESQQTIPLHYTMDGQADRPVVTLAASYGGDADDLAAKMLRAYCGMRPEEPDGEERYEGERDLRHRMTALAHAAVDGGEAAYRWELRQHWLAFNPVNPSPNGLDIAAEAAAVIEEALQAEDE